MNWMVLGSNPQSKWGVYIPDSSFGDCWLNWNNIAYDYFETIVMLLMEEDVLYPPKCYKWKSPVVYDVKVCYRASVEEGTW